MLNFQFRQTLFERCDLLNDRVGQVALIHLIVNANAVAADYAGRNSDRGAVFGDFPNHHGVGSDLAVGTDLNGSQHFGARTDHYVIPDGGVTFADVFTRSAEGHALVDRAIVADLGGLTDDNAHTVVDEKTFADLCTGVNLDPR